MTDIGVLGLDTSHPESFADVLERRSDATLAAVWDGNDVRTREYVESFCDDHDATRYDDSAQMVDAVDAAMILTVDWDTHLPLARPFLEAGIPTFVDKPLAGRVSEVDDFTELAREGTRLFGGSAVPFHPNIDRLPRDVPERSLFAAGYNDYFYYRVHLSDTVRRIAGSAWTHVEPQEGPGSTVNVRFENGTHATVRFDGSTENGAFGVLDVADRTRAVEIPATEGALAEMYVPFIDAFLETVRGTRDDTGRVVDSARLGLAVEAALGSGETVTPNSRALTNVEKDGGAFLAGYEPYY